ncbi:MAG: methyltransferase domain-containing protein [Chitinophagaceae bacterium]|nr:methyltransferase domain-containing protein [Chitinophagaceae bacterium]
MSPVTGKDGVQKFDSVDAASIVNLYKKQLDVDVSQVFQGLSKIEILKCGQTGYHFYYPFNLAGDAAFYEELQHKMTGNLSYYRGWGYDHAFAINKVRPNEAVLDIGCGSGNFLEKAREITDNVTGLEFNEKAINECRKKGLSVQNETIEKHAGSNPEKYDLVCIFQVLEHIYDIKPFLEASVATVKKGGRLIIGVPNNEPYLQGYHKYSTLNLPPHHMGMWNKSSFEKIQDVYGIKLLEVVYDGKATLTLDMYYRAKMLWGIKSEIQHHTKLEKLKMLLAAPITFFPSFYRKITRGLSSRNIVVVFEKI